MRSVSATLLSYPALKYGSEVLIPARATPRGGVETCVEGLGAEYGANLTLDGPLCPFMWPEP